MKNCRFGILGAILFSGALVSDAGNLYYVNADIGDDAYDGSSPSVLSETVGPKGTLMGALSLAKNGDTVYAAAGVYTNGIYEADGYRYRAYVGGGVKLIGEGPDTTFIVGAKDPDGDANGCGSAAVACVRLEYTSATKKGGIIRGFSVSGGRPCASSSERAVGISGNSWFNLAVDCVISNNYNTYRGGGVSDITCARCVFAGGNIAKDISYSGTAYGATYFINCVFHPGETGMYRPSGGISLFNCTGVNVGFRPKDGTEVTCRNCIVYSSRASHHYYNCLLKGEAASGAVLEPDCRTNVTDEQLDLDENFIPRSGSIAVGGCTNDYYEAALKTFWNVEELDKDLDVAGLLRKMGAAIDIGAGEYDLHGAFASVLSPRNLVVTGAGDDVAETGDGKLSVPVANDVSVVWSAPPGAGTKELDFRFTAKVTGGATLEVTRGAEKLVSAVASDGEKTWTFKAVGDQELVFSVTGESGGAELSGFANSTLVSIVDGCGGLEIDGIASASAELTAGETVSVAISRDYTTRMLCTGLMVGGEFFPFTGTTSDNVYTRTIAAGDADLKIEAVYAEHNTWYVDASAGSDDADGRAPYRAKKTLQAAMEIAGLAVGDTVKAAAGRYDCGKYEEFDDEGNLTRRYRVRIPDGVLLEGEGAERTFIAGIIDSAGTRGCGPGAMRCVMMEDAGNGAVLKGFTVCEGRTLNAADFNNLGGGITAGNLCYAIDCVISNNAAYRGGGANGGRYIRCRFTGNSCANTNAGDGYNIRMLRDCRLDSGVYVPDYAVTYCNSTFASSPWALAYQVNLRNCIVQANIGAKCVCENTLTTGSLDAADSYDDRTMTVTAEALALDEAGVPGVGSVALDYGSNMLYEAGLPTDHWAFGHMGFGVDCGGSQRIYNAVIDVGAYEYDRRGDFAAKLSGDRRFSVEAATPGVTNAVDGVVLSPEANGVSLVWRGRGGGRANLLTSLSGDGALTVTVDGVQVEPDASGCYSFVAKPDETKVEVAYAGTGSAKILSFSGPKNGTVMFVR